MLRIGMHHPIMLSGAAIMGLSHTVSHKTAARWRAAPGGDMAKPILEVDAGIETVAKARWCGLAYLAVIVAAPFAEMYVRAGAVIRGDSAATAANILARETLWRWAGVADFITAACDVAVAILLYELLKPAGKTASLSAAIFRLILVAISAVNILFHMAPLTLLNAGATYLSNFTAGQLQNLAYLSIRLHGQVYDILLVFFGLHCLLIGYLIARTTYLPRFFGWAMTLTGVCYIANTLVRFLEPGLGPTLYPWLLLPAFATEIGFSLWLLLRGVDKERWRMQAAS